MIFHDVKMELFHLSGVRKGVILVLILFYMIDGFADFLVDQDFQAVHILPKVHKARIM